eukprot:57297-Pyramimonas_sp.AAC.1
MKGSPAAGPPCGRRERTSAEGTTEGGTRKPGCRLYSSEYPPEYSPEATRLRLSGINSTHTPQHDGVPIKRRIGPQHRPQTGGEFTGQGGEFTGQGGELTSLTG